MKRLALILVLALLCAGCRAKVPDVTAQPPYSLPESLYAPEDFRMENGLLSLTAGTAVMGIDVSSHQGLIDWQAVKQAGVQFAFVRLGYRGYESGTLMTDEYVKINLNGAREAGIPVGAYFFSQAVSPEEAKKEAAYALGILDGFSLELPLVYDWEYVSDTARTANMDRETLTACTLAFCEAVEEAGYAPMVYFNSSQITALLDGEQIEKYPWWIAKYDLSADFVCRGDLWQYTNQGSLPGISGAVDINLMFTDYGLGKTLFGTP